MLAPLLFVICIGPVCVPIWGVLPVIYYIINKFRECCGGPGHTKKTDNDDVEIALSSGVSAEESSENLKDVQDADAYFERRAAVQGGVRDITNIGDWEETLQTLKSASAHRSSQVFIKFTAVWCQPCKRIAPIFEELSQSYKHPNTRFVSVDVDQVKELKKSYQVSILPAFKVISLTNHSSSADSHEISIESNSSQSANQITSVMEKMEEEMVGADEEKLIDFVTRNAIHARCQALIDQQK